MSKKTLMLNVDHHDLALVASAKGEELYDEERIKKLMEDCAKNDVDTVFWRTSVCGKVAYPSKVMTVFDGDFRPYVGRALPEILKKCDVMEVATRYAHRSGLRIFAWITLIDSYNVDKQDNFFLQHPEFLMMSRKKHKGLFNHAFRGVPCYSCPETREYRLAETKELASYAVDGILYELGGPHDSQIKRIDDPQEENCFGYNEPIVAEYKRRYGVDILKEDFDVDKWAKLLAEGLTLFLKMTREELNSKGKEMYVSTPLAKYLGNSQMIHKVKVYNDWKGWVEKKIVDALVFRGHCYSIENPEVVDEIEKETVNIRERGCKVMAWYTLFNPEATQETMRRIVEKIRDSSLDGATFHEAANIYYGARQVPTPISTKEYWRLLRGLNS